jgi:hypothetical protein
LAKKKKNTATSASSARSSTTSRSSVGNVSPPPTRETVQAGARTSAAATRSAAQASNQQRIENNRTSAASSRNRRKRAATRNTTWWWVGGIVVVVAIIVGVFVLVSNQKPAGTIGGTDPTVLKEVTSVSSTTLSSVGTGGLDSQKPVTPITGQPALTGPNGKPEFFYYGAEFCPYCAANRWSMTIALSRFGTFTQLPETLSSSTDTDANTATFTFLGSKYTSSYIDFVPVEAEDRDQKPLQQPTAAQNQLLQTFKITGFPFLDIGNKYQAGALYDPSTLANLSQRDIAAKLSNPNDSITRNIVGGANYLTAAICAVTNNQPGNVCSDSTIQTIEQSLQSQSNSQPSGAQVFASSIATAYTERRSRL